VPLSYDILAASQESDNELRTLLRPTTDPWIKKLLIPGTMASIYCDTSARRSRPYIRAPLLLQVFQSNHDLSHLGTKAMTKLVAQRFVWPGVQKDCHICGRACQSCQRSQRSSLPPHSHSIWRLYTTSSPFPARPQRPRRVPSDVNGLHTLPHCSRPFHPLARSCLYPGYHSRHQDTPY
jgi:hypothetical protein